MEVVGRRDPLARAQQFQVDRRADADRSSSALRPEDLIPIAAEVGAVVVDDFRLGGAGE